MKLTYEEAKEQIGNMVTVATPYVDKIVWEYGLLSGICKGQGCSCNPLFTFVLTRVGQYSDLEKPKNPDSEEKYCSGISDLYTIKSPNEVRNPSLIDGYLPDDVRLELLRAKANEKFGSFVPGVGRNLTAKDLGMYSSATSDQASKADCPSYNQADIPTPAPQENKHQRVINFLSSSVKTEQHVARILDPGSVGLVGVDELKAAIEVLKKA